MDEITYGEACDKLRLMGFESFMISGLTGGNRVKVVVNGRKLSAAKFSTIIRKLEKITQK